MKKIIFVLGIFLLIQESANSACSLLESKRDGIYIQQFPPRQGDPCLIKVAPRGGSSSQTINFNQLGQLMFSIETGHSGKLSKDMGSRTYYILPTSDQMQLLDSSATSPTVIRSSTGLDFTLVKVENELSISDISNCDKKDSKSAWYTNRELNIKQCPGRIIIDSGFAKGKQAIQNPKGFSKIIGENGSSCDVPNSALFNYSKNLDTPTIKIQSELEIKSFLYKFPSCHLVRLNSSSDTTSSSTSSGAQ